MRLLRRAKLQRLSRDAHVAGCIERKAGQRPQHFDRAGPDLTGETDYRAAQSGQIEILHDWRHAQIPDHQRGLARPAFPARIHLPHAAAEHQFHELRPVDLLRPPRADQLAVAQHRDGIADLKDLAEPVGDVDDRFAFGAKRAQRIEDAFDLDVGERRRRFVQHEYPRIAGQHPRQLDQLPPPDAQLRDRRLQRKIAQAHLRER